MYMYEALTFWISSQVNVGWQTRKSISLWHLLYPVSILSALPRILTLISLSLPSGQESKAYYIGH